MNKKFSMSLSALLLSTVIHTAYADDNTIVFKGKVNDAACLVNIGTNGRLEVDMPEVRSADFGANVGAINPNSWKPFTISLTDCRKATKNNIKISFQAAQPDGDYIGLTGASRAKGVAVVLANQNKEVLTGNSFSNEMRAGENAFNFQAGLVRTIADTVVQDADPIPGIVPGDVYAEAAVNVEYY
ncbi:fimbrial protein [Pantoea sp. NSTU24]|uniref:fimbrial protein n=1 Tax=Pantoea sp. NSTU24 TaxID=3391144 RepID=UPI003D01164D